MSDERLIEAVESVLTRRVVLGPCRVLALEIKQAIRAEGLVVVKEAWAKAAKCPACDGSGAIPVERAVPSGETDSMGYEVPAYVTDWEQCQWCDELKAMIGEE